MSNNELFTENFLIAGNPVAGALVKVESIDHPVLTTEAGEYWRVLRPGDYSISATSRDGRLRSRRVPVRVTARQTEIINLSLTT